MLLPKALVTDPPPDRVLSVRLWPFRLSVPPVLMITLLLAPNCALPAPARRAVAPDLTSSTTRLVPAKALIADVPEALSSTRVPALTTMRPLLLLLAPPNVNVPEPSLSR